MKAKLWYVLGVLCFIFKATEGRWVEAKIETNDDWAFVARFCFLSKQGALIYNFLYPLDYGTQEILLYYDEPGQWESVYKSDKNCSARRSVLSVANNQIIALNTSYTRTSRYSGCALTTVDGDKYYNCSGGRTFRSMRERWWYIAVARCDVAFGSVTGLNLQYKLHMTNGELDDIWHYEFSADEFYILSENIGFVVAYLIMLCLSIVCAVVLKGKQLFHSTYKMYMVALTLWFFGLLLMCIAWGQYGGSGWQEKPTEVTGRLFQAASNVIFILMLILMAKGYSITRGRLPQMSTIRITVFFCLFIVVYATLFIWEGLFFDEGLVLYFYESPPGYGLVIMQLVGWLWFLYAIFFTLKHHANKGNFYFPFFIFYTIWFWAGPVVVLVAMFAMAKWSREKTVFGVEQFVGLCGHLFFLILTRPSAANSNFPYHVRTCQIATIIDPSDDSSPRSDGSSYQMSKEGGGGRAEGGQTYSSEETQLGRGPDLAALFIVQPSSTPVPPTSSSTTPTANNKSVGNLSQASRASMSGPPKLPPAYTSLNLPPLRTQVPVTASLPPLGGTALPHIGGLTLPPLPTEPSAPLEEDDQYIGVPPPPSYDSMFVAKGK